MFKFGSEIRLEPLRLSAGTVAGNGSPTADTERALLEILTDVVEMERASVDDHFFNDLGADSLVMARFCARVRKRPDLPVVTIKDVYAYPAVRSLAEALDGALFDAPMPSAPREEPAQVPVARRRAGTPMYVLCGVIQLLIFAVYLAVTEAAAVVGEDWISAAANVSELFLRAAVYGDAAVLTMCILPIIAKCVLIGRWTTQEFPVWSLAYLRFWLVKTLVRANPLLLLVGGRSRSNTTSPIVNIYLRALGANIGPGVTIYSRPCPSARPTRRPSFRAIPRRTAPSSPTTSRSVPASPSAPARGSTTARQSATTSSSSHIPTS